MAVVLGSTSTTVATGFLPISGYDGSGTYNNTDIAGGGIIRVKKTVYDTPTSFTVTLNSIYNLSSLFSVSIAPTNTSSRILINCRFAGEMDAPYQTVCHVLRNGSSITVPTVAYGNRGYGLICPGDSYAAAAANFSTTPCGVDYWWMDAPASTATLTYSLGLIASAGSTTMYINRTLTDLNTSSERMSSSIMVMEVTG